MLVQSSYNMFVQYCIPPESNVPQEVRAFLVPKPFDVYDKEISQRLHIIKPFNQFFQLEVVISHKKFPVLHNICSTVMKPAAANDAFLQLACSPRHKNISHPHDGIHPSLCSSVCRQDTETKLFKQPFIITFSAGNKPHNLILVFPDNWFMIELLEISQAPSDFISFLRICFQKLIC